MEMFCTGAVVGGRNGFLLLSFTMVGVFCTGAVAGGRNGFLLLMLGCTGGVISEGFMILFRRCRSGDVEKKLDESYCKK